MKILIFALMILIMASSNVFAYWPISPGFYYFSDESGISLSARGTFIGEGDKIIYDPENPSVAEIFCYKPENTCTVAEARVTGANGVNGGGLLDVVNYTYDVIRWDSNIIIAEKKEAICYSNRLLIDRKLKTIKNVNIPKAYGDLLYNEKFCGKSNKVFTNILIDGQKAWSKEITDNCKKYSPIPSQCK